LCRFFVGPTRYVREQIAYRSASISIMQTAARSSLERYTPCPLPGGAASVESRQLDVCNDSANRHLDRIQIVPLTPLPVLQVRSAC
jgi:hypothetical protein